MFVGLTGGIACGKSLVAGYLRELGAHIIDADELAHRLLEPGRPGYQAVRAAFGAQLGHPADGAPIDRRRLGAIVFAEPAQRARLEAILHPMIFAETTAKRAEIEQREPGALIVFVAPLLFETGADRRVERTVAVVTDEETQISRLMARDGIARDEARLRLRAQLPVEEKRRRAHDVIDGGRPKEEVRRQVEALARRLKSP